MKGGKEKKGGPLVTKGDMETGGIEKRKKKKKKTGEREERVKGWYKIQKRPFDH